jgi:undecaprenyl-diphosphatase
MTDKKQIPQPRFYRKNLIITAIAVFGAASLLCYFLADARVFNWLCQNADNWHKSRWLAAFEQFGKVWALIWLLLLWGIITRRPRPALVGLLALLIMTATVLPTKSLVQRPRPRDILKQKSPQETKNHLTRSWSFPSGDAAAVFAVAVAAIPFTSLGWSPLMLIAAAGIAVLRVIVMAHYPSDVCAGAAAGVFSGWLALQIARRWILLESFNPHWFDITAVIALIIIPICIAIFGKIWHLIDFFTIVAILAACILLITKLDARLKRAPPHKNYPLFSDKRR